MEDASQNGVNGNRCDVADIPIYSWPGAETDAEAARVAALAYKPGISSMCVRQRYDDLSLDYDNYLDVPGSYNGPKYAADAIKRHFGDDINVGILDVASGTGLVCKELNDRGFTNVDALDPSTKMMEVAKKKNLYKNHYIEFLGQHNSSITNDAYDAITVAGGMGEGHIPCSALVEMARIVKSGGIVVITLRKEYLNTCTDYRERWAEYLQQLEEKSVWQQLEDRVVLNYAFGKSGLVCVFRVNSQGRPLFTFNE